ncbi:MAG: hypothetical protein SVZ03_10850 [Spirochaetota bacterium]|nr:hypothetical protein [Spirochaetota bacterium]
MKERERCVVFPHQGWQEVLGFAFCGLISMINRIADRWFIVFIVCFLLSSCATFVNEKEAMHLKEYEMGIYTLKDTIGEEDRVLKKGERISLYILVGGDSIKVYAYPSNVDFLKSSRTLLLYLFEDDFENKAFNIDYFNKRLWEILEQKEAKGK